MSGKDVVVVSVHDLFEESRDHPGVLSDERRRELNVMAGRELCERCAGTGNQLYRMYQRCEACEGRGFIADVETN